MSTLPSFGGNSSTVSPWPSSTDNKRSQPTPMKTPPGTNSDNLGSANMSFNKSMSSASSTFIGNSGVGDMGVGGGGRVGGGLPKQSISFPKQNLNTTTFGATGSIGTPGSSTLPMGFRSTTNTEALSSSSVSSPFGNNKQSNPYQFMTTSITPNNSSTTPTPKATQIPFQSSSLPTPTFQPNSFLSRSSPSSAAMSPGMTSPHFIKPQNQQQGDDLASCVGLRRRTGGLSGPSGNGTNVLKRPPLPNMTRLGVSTETFDDFKENIQNGTKTNNYDTKAKGMSPPSILKSRGGGLGSSGIIVEKKKEPPQSWKSNEKQEISNEPINYCTWVLIYGFTNDLEYDTIVANFESYGTITERFPSTYSNGFSKNGVRSGSNWICVKYESSLEAEKALCQNQSLIHVVGQHSYLSSGIGSGSTSGNMNNTSTFQDVIVAVGVMRVDETVAMRVGLTNYLENGSTGFKRATTSESDNSNTDPTMRNVRFASSIQSENDILLLGNEHLNYKFGNGSSSGHQRDNGGVCNKFLRWFFKW